MKRKIILVATLFSISLYGCSKEEEPATLAVAIPQNQPVEVITEIDQEPVYQGVGSFCMFPSAKDGAAVAAGTNEICIYFEREDIVAGTGYISVFDTSDTSHVYDVIDVLDEEHCSLTPIDDFGRNYTGWETGSMFTLYLDSPFMPGHSYYMDLMEGNFMTQDGQFVSQAFKGEEVLNFSSLDYGMVPKVPLMTNDFVTGDTVSYDILLGSGAVRADIAGYDSFLISPDQTAFYENGVLTLSFLSPGTTTFVINFYDSEDMLIDSIVYSLRIML